MRVAGKVCKAVWRLFRRVVKRKARTALEVLTFRHEPPCGFEAITSEVYVDDQD